MTAIAERKAYNSRLKHVEAELYQYPHIVKEIEKRRMELLYPYQEYVDENQGKGVNSVRAISRQTERIATRLVEDRKLRNYEEIADAIERVYNGLDKNQMKFVRVKYWSGKNYSAIQVADMINVSERTCHYYRKKVLEEIGHIIGWV
ncbi:transcriptional regulator [Shouchella miscanthi]|uniref:transcriptional regulator n=1 Tax=Shouchella miscanthi TaxID=2598861 RepID=UPI0011A9FA1C|nr:transcriptional regulator [Shouchella miscanthi]